VRLRKPYNRLTDTDKSLKYLHSSHQLTPKVLLWVRVCLHLVGVKQHSSQSTWDLSWPMNESWIRGAASELAKLLAWSMVNNFRLSSSRLGIGFDKPKKRCSSTIVEPLLAWASWPLKVLWIGWWVGNTSLDYSTYELVRYPVNPAAFASPGVIKMMGPPASPSVILPRIRLGDN